MASSPLPLEQTLNFIDPKGDVRTARRRGDDEAIDGEAEVLLVGTIETTKSICAIKKLVLTCAFTFTKPNQLAL